MRSHYPILFALAIATFIAAKPALATPPAGYNLEWTEEFNEGVGSLPNSAYWTYDLGAGGWGNDELETYVQDTTHSVLVADPNAEDGYALQITATNDNGGVGTAGQYSSARLNTGGMVMPEYGYIESRIQMPEGDGIWPAFWTLGWNIGSVGWPACGEQDIMENIGMQSWWGINQGSLHAPNWNPDSQYDLASGDYFWQGYHTFGELWTPTSVSYFVDGNLYETNTVGDATAAGGTWAFSGRPSFFITNVAVGGDFPGNPDSSTTFPQKMLVDYIKVYDSPYNGQHYVPGVVQAEDFDNGGQAISYSTTTNTNNGGQYRPELGVGIENTTGGGYDVGWTGAGQWMKYQVNVQTAGTYKLTARVSNDSSPSANGSFHIADETGTNLTGSITVAPTGGWQTWTNVTANVALTAGAHTLQLVEETGNFNIDYMAFTSSSGAFDGPHNLPGVVQCEDYNQGGEGVGFHSLTTAANPDNIFRNDPVTVENCSTGGYDVTSTAAGQWLKYSVDASTTGLYNVAVHVASATGGGQFHLVSETGAALTGEVTVPSTSAAQTWTMVNTIVNLSAGAHTIQLVEDSGGYSLDSMTFTLAFNDSHYLPGSVAAADYDLGGEGLAYHMMSPFTPGTSPYRSGDAVGIEASSLSTFDGLDVGWTQAGQWTNYTVFANLAGTYTATFTVASGANGGTFHLTDENGNNLTGTVTVPGTGGWSDWTTVTATVTLPAGGQVLQLDQDSAGFNIAGMTLTNNVASATVSSFGLSPATVNGGATSQATVTLSAPAVNSIGPDGQTVLSGQAALITSSSSSATVASGANVISVGGSTYVVVPAGQSTASFTVDTSAVSSTTVATLGATLAGVDETATLTIDSTSPAAPTNLAATAGNAQVALTWTASTGATSYNVYVGTASGGESATPVATGVTTASHTVTGLTNGTKYYFTVKAVNSAGTSAASNEASATPEPTTPPAPTNLTATAGSAQTSLTWTASTGATSYNVYDGTTSGGENATPVATGVTAATYTVIGLTNGIKYYFTVKAVNGGGTSTASNEASATPEPVAPPAPTNLTATASNAQASLTWTASAGATSYNVYDGTTSGGESATPVATDVTSASYVVTGLANGTKYYFTVKAVNGGGTSAASNEASATLAGSAPSAPTDLTATAGNAQAALAWAASNGATSYNVYQGTSSGGEGSTPIATGIKTVSYSATGLANGTKYYFTVAGVDASGVGAVSNEALTTPEPPLTYPSGVQLISSPLDFSGTSLDTVFGLSDVVVAVWNPADYEYALSPTAPAGSIGLGTGYWIALPHSVTVTATGTPASTSQDFTISLTKGWNQVGDPFFTSVALSLLLVNGSTFAAATAGSSPLVSSSVWGYNSGTNAYVAATSLAPLSGYWVYAYSNVTLDVPHP